MGYLYLNPFVTISASPHGYRLHVALTSEVLLTRESEALVQLLLTGEPIAIEDVRYHLSNVRIKELVTKRVLLESKPPPLEGRYSRQLGLFSLLVEDYQSHHSRLEMADVLLLGAGAIGSHVLWNLAAMGVRNVTIVDFDTITESNLNRQLMYDVVDIGQPKVDVLCSKIKAFNPNMELTPIVSRINSPQDIVDLLPGKTLVIKAIDTPDKATEWVNEACVAASVPFIAGGFVGYVGVIGPIYIPNKSMCALCGGASDISRIHGTGATFAPLTTIVASMMAMCTYRIITGLTDTLINKIYTYDMTTDAWKSVAHQMGKECEVCGTLPPNKLNPVQTVPSRRSLLTYRCIVMLFIMMTVLFRYVWHDRFIGIYMLVVLFCSMFVLDRICDGDLRETRKQIFITSCMYSITSLLVVIVNMLVSHHGAFRWGVEDLFNDARLLCSLTSMLAIVIAILFFALVGVVRIAKKLSTTMQSGVLVAQSID
jgi:molybdopterin/thiamine biosynthesis adenylyltransferase